MNPWTVGVCGFGRCGSTMVMAMLDAGGCAPVDEAKPGSYETDMQDLFGRHPSGRAVKLLDHATHFGAPLAAEAWRFVWIDRDPLEQAKSIVKFVGTLADQDVSVEDVAASMAFDRPKALGELRRAGSVLVLSYERVLVSPRRAAKLLRQVWPSLDVAAAAAVVHDRDPACLPDLTFELSTPDSGAA